jgi:hypothetical protein
MEILGDTIINYPRKTPSAPARLVFLLKGVEIPLFLGFLLFCAAFKNWMCDNDFLLEQSFLSA